MQKIIDSQRKAAIYSLSVEQRKKLLKKLRKAILYQQQELFNAFKIDMGKCQSEVYLVEIVPVIREIDHFIKSLSKWSYSKNVGGGLLVPFSSNKVVYQSYGSVLIIAPWNYPFHLAMMPLVGAIGAGNGVVIKPSFKVGNVVKVIRAIVEEVFEEKQVYVVKDNDEGYKVLDFKWDFVFFTGGAEVGKRVAQTCGENLTPVCLELGGKSPVIVDNGCNIDLAAKRIAWGKILNSGQTCVAPDYAIVTKGLEYKLTEKIALWMRKFSENTNERVKIIDNIAWERLNSLVEQSRDKIIFGGKTSKDNLYIEPSIFINVDYKDALMQNEIFGPLLPIMVVENIDEGLNYILRREKPLAIYYFGNKNGEKLLKQKSSSGALVINDVIMHIGSKGLPFGGVGASGMGRYHGKYSFELFSHAKAVLKQPLWIDIRMRYSPYLKLKTIKKIFK